jgi:hypothetical protein
MSCSSDEEHIPLCFQWSLLHFLPLCIHILPCSLEKKIYTVIAISRRALATPCKQEDKQPVLLNNVPEEGL